MLSAALVLCLVVHAHLKPGVDADAATRQRVYQQLVKEIQGRKIDPLVPPFPDEGPVPVELSFQLHRVIKLDSDSAVLSITGMMRIAWTDGRYAWNETDRPDSVLLPSDIVWIPEFMLDSSPTFRVRAGAHVLQVKRDGHIIIEKTIMENVACAVDVRLFPRDIQDCALTFVPSISYRGLVEPRKHRGDGEKISSNVGEEWGLLGCLHSVEIVSLHHSNGTVGQQKAYIARMLLFRNHMFYLLTIIIPTMMLALMVVVPYAIPPNLAAPKVIIPVTTFLSFNIYMMLLERTLPKTSSLPVLGKSYAAMLSVGLITEICQAISVKFYSCHLKRIPRWLEFLYFRIFAFICCFHACHGIEYRPRRDDDHLQMSTSERKKRIQKSWIIMGRINDRLGLGTSLIIIILGLVYLFVNLYTEPDIPKEFRNTVNMSVL